MSNPHIQQALQELGAAEQAALVELLLSQIAVVVHGLHEGANAVDRSLGHTAVLAFQSFDYFVPYRFSEAGQVREGREADFASHESSQGVELRLDLAVGLQLLVHHRVQSTQNYLVLVLREESLQEFKINFINKY